MCLLGRSECVGVWFERRFCWGFLCGVWVLLGRGVRGSHSIGTVIVIAAGGLEFLATSTAFAGISFGAC